ncbi:MAG: hypothetical protein JWO68_1769 [Actinomycetia bacterium]|nr:hypothetical protein [Actinomycetes bacterium]
MTMVLRPGQSVEDLVARGNTACPGCAGALSRWGQARSRVVRGPGGEQRLRPRRVRCRACRVTHVVLPPDALLRRRDGVAVVGRAWRSAAAGAGARRVAHQLGVPMETVRGWLRRLRVLVQEAYGGPTDGHQDRLRRGLAFLTAEADAAGCRDEADLWRFVAFRSQGRLLCNTNWL